MQDRDCLGISANPNHIRQWLWRKIASTSQHPQLSISLLPLQSRPRLPESRLQFPIPKGCIVIILLYPTLPLRWYCIWSYLLSFLLRLGVLQKGFGLGHDGWRNVNAGIPRTASLVEWLRLIHASPRPVEIGR